MENQVINPLHIEQIRYIAHLEGIVQQQAQHIAGLEQRAGNDSLETLRRDVVRLQREASWWRAAYERAAGPDADLAGPPADVEEAVVRDIKKGARKSS